MRATKRPVSAVRGVPATGYPATPDRTVCGDWTRSTRVVPAGTELSLKGERGRFRLRAHVVLADGREWLDLVHPQFGFRSVRPERVRVVHRSLKLRPATSAGRAMRGAA